VHGARENNLEDVSVKIPKRRLIVFTGVPGSGKSCIRPISCEASRKMMAGNEPARRRAATVAVNC
jgi:excinuclease UvrABC ATPase subunit